MPVPVPFSRYCQVKVVLVPAASVLGLKVVAVVAPAPPVVAMAGMAGEGSTLVMGTALVFCTVMLASNVCPRVSVAGTVKAVMTSAPGTCTLAVLELAEGAVRAAPELASVPVAPVESVMVPGAVPFSVQLQVKMAVAPPAMVAGVGIPTQPALAPPVPATAGGVGEGTTLLAVASPVLVTTAVAVKICPREMVPGMVKVETCRLAGACTADTTEEIAPAVTAPPELASVPTAPAVKRSVPVPVPFSV